MLTYDITNPKSFDSLDSWRQEFLVQAGPSDEDNFPFVVLGNKVDKEAERRGEKRRGCEARISWQHHLTSSNRISNAAVGKSKAAQWCKSKGGDAPVPHMQTSAKEAVQVEAAFLEAAKLALARDTGDDDIFIPETINLNNQQAAKQSGGCC